jgi:hypothetical protein
MILYFAIYFMECVYCILQFIPWIVSIVLYNLFHGLYLLYFTIYYMDFVYCTLQDTVHVINCKIQWTQSME